MNCVSAYRAWAQSPACKDSCDCNKHMPCGAGVKSDGSDRPGQMDCYVFNS
jgi:hypothetical protein